jgi:CubicO group peptidase (beta-lactamase class C family)
VNGRCLLFLALALCGLALACGTVHIPQRIPASDLMSNQSQEFDDFPLSQRNYARVDFHALDRSIDTLLNEAVSDEMPPSAVIAVGDETGLILRRAFGFARLEPGRAQPARIETMYDMASLTKCIATTTAIMQLWERGEIDLDAPIITYLPEYDNNGKEAITVRQCLTHTAGFKPFYKLWEEVNSGEEARWFIENCTPDWEPGTVYRYSDVGYVTLAWIVERVSGQRLDAYCRDNIFQPLGMTNTMFTPPEALRSMCAATEFDQQMRHEMIQGFVHDENAAFLGGVAGHAGLFSTVTDVATFCTMLLRGGELRGQRILKPETIAEMTRIQIDMEDADDNPVARGLGWWLRARGGFLASCGGRQFSDATFGHTGYTGPALQIDPERGVYAIFLANRVHARSDQWTNPEFRAESWRRFRPIRVAFFDTVADKLH